MSVDPKATDINFHKEPKVPLWRSCRLTLAAVGFFVFYHVYVVRINISVAIVCMTSSPKAHILKNITNITTCDTEGQNDLQKFGGENISCHEKSGHLHGEFDWDRRLQGYILGSFFYGYLVTQIAGGWLSSVLGAKHVLGCGILLSGISTLFVPLLARAHVGLLIAQRVFVGLMTAVAFPSVNAMWGKWAPPLERTKLAALTTSGIPIGILVTNTISGVLCEYGFAGGWPSIFYITGMTTCLVWIFWMFFAFSSPADHPRITAEERHFIETSIGHTSKTVSHIPWKAMLKSPPALSIFVCHFCANWGLYTLLTGMPMYMSDVLHVSMSKAGALSAVPTLVATLCYLGNAFLVDYLRKRRVWSTGTARKFMQGIGTFIPSACLIGISFLDHTKVTFVMVLFGLSGFFGSARGSSYNVNHVDIAPRYAGVLYGISNTLATVAGMIAPIMMGELTQNGTRSEWQLVFIISSAINCFGALVFIIFASGEEQEWAKKGAEDIIEPTLNKGQIRPMLVNNTVDEDTM